MDTNQQLPEPSPLVAQVHDAMPRMSPAERRVARAVLSDFPRAALGTVSHLATAAEVSTATVVRFCTRLGLDGFAAFTTLVREELSSSSVPVVRARSSRADAALDAELEHRTQLVRAIMQTAPTPEVERLVEALCDTRHTVVTAGGSLSQLAARYLQLQLRHVRPRVFHLADPSQSDLGTVLDLKRRDLVVLFDFRRYEARTRRIAEEARRRGATVALFTDVWLSPVANIADIVLPVEVEASFLDSFVAVFALVESIVPAAAARLGESSLRRMDELETLRASSGC